MLAYFESWWLHSPIPSTLDCYCQCLNCLCRLFLVLSEVELRNWLCALADLWYLNIVVRLLKIRDKIRVKLNRKPIRKWFLQSAFSRSLSLHGNSAMLAANSIFFALIIEFTLAIRLWSGGIFLGLGGTAGLFDIGAFGGGDSSELDSSCPAVVKFTEL